MKQYTSKFFKSVALSYMAFPVLYLFFVAIIFDIPGSQCVRILLSPSYYGLSLFAVIAGYGLWEAKRWAYYAFLVVNLLTLYTNAVLLSEFGQTNHKTISFTFSFLVVAGLMYRVSREIRVPYFLPRIRWWESNPRYKLMVPVSILRKNDEALQGEIMDLSVGGCFIKLRTELPLDESLNLTFTIFEHPLSLLGTVVWKSQSTVTHPKGVGVKFGSMTRSQRWTLKAIAQRLRKIAAFYRSSRYLISQEDFVRRYEELQKAELIVSKKSEQQLRAK